MGAILDLPAAAEPFGAEARRESFYVGTGMDAPALMARRGAFSVQFEHLPALRVALEAVQLDPNCQRWQRGEDLKLDDVGPHSPAMGWTVTRQDDRLVVVGRVIAFTPAGSWAPAQSVELAYRDLAELLQLLATSA